MDRRDATLGAALAISGPDRRRQAMRDIQQILQDSGLIIQPFWQSLFCHMSDRVKNHATHQTFQLDLQEVGLQG